MVSAHLKGEAPVTLPTGEFTTFGCQVIANGTELYAAHGVGAAQQ